MKLRNPVAILCSGLLLLSLTTPAVDIPSTHPSSTPELTDQSTHLILTAVESPKRLSDNNTNEITQTTRGNVSCVPASKSISYLWLAPNVPLISSRLVYTQNTASDL